MFDILQKNKINARVSTKKQILSNFNTVSLHPWHSSCFYHFIATENSNVFWIIQKYHTIFILSKFVLFNCKESTL